MSSGDMDDMDDMEFISIALNFPYIDSILFTWLALDAI